MPIPVVAITASAIAVTIVGGGIVWYFSLEGTYKIIDAPATKMTAAALVIFAIAYLFFVRRGAR